MKNGEIIILFDECGKDRAVIYEVSGTTYSIMILSTEEKYKLNRADVKDRRADISHCFNVEYQ